MKKFTLLLLFLGTVSLGFSQSTRTTKIANPKLTIDLRDQNIMQQPGIGHGSHSNNGAGIRDLTAIPLGSAGNGLTVLNNAANVVTAYDALHSVVFIHRADPTIFITNTTSQYRYDYSTDGGISWPTNQLNIGPLNPNTDGAGEGGKNGRYPQAALFDPTAAGVADSLYFAYLGTWHNGIVSSDLNTWEGTITGVSKINGEVSSFTETIDSVNHGDVGIFTSLVPGTPGVFWSIAPDYDADDITGYPNDSLYVLLKGVWNSELKDVEWSISRIINIPPDLGYDGTTYVTNPEIAFDPTGMKGWIVFEGDYIDDGLFVYQPVFMSTIDGGANWSEPTYIDLMQFDNIVGNLDGGGSGIAMAAYESDLVVDYLGNPHFVNMIGSGVDNGFQSGLPFHCYDLTYHNGAWEAVQLDKAGISAFRGDVGTGAGGVVYSEDNRCQGTMSPDGHKLYFTWIDTDPELVDTSIQNNNQYPNLYGLGLDVDTWKLTSVKNFTSNSDWDGKTMMPNLAPVSLRSSANDATTIPVVIIEVNSNGSFESPANFWYFSNVTVSDADFLTGIDEVSSAASFSVTPNYPNPFSSSTQFDVKLEKSADVMVKVSNVLGETVSQSNYQFGAGTHTISLSCSHLSSGIYFYEVTSGTKTISHKMVVE